MRRSTIRAVVLYSGSLASVVAARLAQRAGCMDLAFVFFSSPFFRGEETVYEEARKLGFPLRFATLKRAFLRLPQEDGGLFPCRVCRRILLARAARLLRARKFDVVITGEIVGQGGLGQDELLALDDELGLTGRVVRPLSAQLLPPTPSEREGSLARGLFLDLAGERAEVGLRDVADSLGIRYNPKGRYCLLRNPGFAQRCRLFAGDGPFTVNFLQLLEFPHLLRLGSGCLLVIAVTPAEQVRLGELFLPEDVRLYVPIPGSPLGLLRAPWAKIAPDERWELVRQAAAHLLAASGFSLDRSWTVCFRAEEAEETVQIRVAPGPCPSIISW